MPTDPQTVPADTAQPLQAAMRRWDGKSAAALAAIYQAHRAAPDFVTDLVAACAHPETETAGTWLIKHHCERGQSDFPEPLRSTLYAQLPEFSSWEAQLHLLQCTDHLPIPEPSAQAVFRSVEVGATATKLLVKAWSLYGAAQLARQHPVYATRVRAMLDQAARREPKGAVAVRLRKAQALLR
ncbi:hypothetical protein [Roseobacter sinensis]|uniref:Uncharacterized protein n=1 Tax=Roseobacter sinensis TaxID=2931391 RepID=A0ABT3BFL4_9RHOB|nr:hypothetical protein [Roseobacter sp. WL0113]MCV3272374.1 hypothetical protein [Roseobacter sp. WL0113]